MRTETILRKFMNSCDHTSHLTQLSVAIEEVRETVAYNSHISKKFYEALRDLYVHDSRFGETIANTSDIVKSNDNLIEALSELNKIINDQIVIYNDTYFELYKAQEILGEADNGNT